jgi:tRNA nucleotidyltransferase/poly(A) polymerase
MKTEMNPQIYLVGGAVRDIILGNAPKDFDYVVVGATPEWMLERGYKQVGAAFPVFLHPEHGSEYALARREKKVAPGYHGFEVEFSTDVTLEEDLSRRDLTINSIAMGSGNKIIDPFDGRKDLKDGIIRHTSEAFAEDPLRVMRVARFAARYGFLIHSDTIELCRNLVNAGELDALSADRIWGELNKLFSEKQSSIGLKFLSKIGALSNVSRLRGLVYDTPSNFTDVEEVEAELRPIERMYLQMPIGGMLNSDIERFRIPSDVVREWKFIDAINTSLNLGKIEVDEYLHQHIVNIFNFFREEIKNGKLEDAVKFFNTMAQVDVKKTKKFFVKLKWAFACLQKLDFTEMVKGMKTSEIKDFVNETKKNTVKKAFEDTQLEPCPFCGEQPSGIDYDGQPAVRMYVSCDCGAQGPATMEGMSPAGSWDTAIGINSAIKKWNERSE